MNNNNNRMAFLESRVDHLETEISYLNHLLVQCGFSEGITTLKMSAEELIKENSFQRYQENSN